MLIDIYGDLYAIDERLKEIENGYRIKYNTLKKTYEIHNKNQPFDSYCLTLPFKELDARTEDYVLKTRIQNKDKFLKEIEKHNEKIQA